MLFLDLSKDKYLFFLSKNILERADISEEIITTN